MTRRRRERGDLSQDRAMPRSIGGRADLIRALGSRDPSITAAMATLLGYHETPVTAPEPTLPSTEPTRPPRTEPPAPLDPPYEPAAVPFWRLEAYEALVREDTPPERPPPRPSAAPVWRKRPSQTPGFTPLAPGRTILTRLRQVSATRHATNEVDSVAVVETLSRGDSLHDIPHRFRRGWGAAIHIIEDRARRLVPYWLDQDYVTDVLRRLYPPHGVTIARIGDGERYPITRWPEERRGEYGLPVPRTLVVVLGDLGCLAREGDDLRRFWLQWGRRLRDNHNPAVALVPAQLKDIPSDLARTWTVVRWDVGTAVGADGSPQATENTVQLLLTLLSPVVRLEPGLLRAVRCLLPEGRRDPGLEARLWQDAAISSRHSVAATLDPTQRKAYLQRFADQPGALRQAVLRQVRAWRADLHVAIWFEEVLGLDAPSQRELVDAEDLQDALRFWPAFTSALRQSGQPSTDTRAWAYRFIQRLPDIVCPDTEVRQAVHELFELVRPYLEDTEVPAWYDPAVLSPEGQTVRRVMLWQLADQILFRVVEPALSAEPYTVTRGSPLGVVHTASGEIKLASIQGQRLADEFWQAGQPPEWAQRWGHDACGPWVTFRINDVEQRMRWIPPGRFLMGSPPEEEGRFDWEGPQHTVQLTRGYWLCDIPCTQALWQAVMGTNPSRFNGEQRPVEQVSWEDCQTFIGKLNAQLPGLELCLPTEAQWEYACRAGAETARYDKDVDAIVWYNSNSNDQTHNVGEKRPNAWGLYDMLGNVWEWCHDGERRYARASVVEPVGPLDAGANRVIRGGSWGDSALDARAADRRWDLPGYRIDLLGFRCASSGVGQPGAARATWSESQRQAEPAKTATRMPAARLLNLQRQPSMVTGFPDGEGFSLSTDREQLHFGRITRPLWATEIGRDVYGLWVMFEVKSVRQRMRWIPPGRFLMGSPPEEEGRFDDEGPRHAVQLTRGFWLCDTLCTQALWQAVMGRNPSRFKGKNRPVEFVSWEDCQTFLDRLNVQLPDLALRLPTEAQWEYACRAGTETARYDEDVDAIAWYADNSNDETHEVSQKHPNAWGLYDILGNVYEWCHDGQRDYEPGAVVDPIGPTDAGAYRVFRGGSWDLSAQDARAANRLWDHPGFRYVYLGFRCASSG